MKEKILLLILFTLLVLPGIIYLFGNTGITTPSNSNKNSLSNSQNNILNEQINNIIKKQSRIDNIIHVANHKPSYETDIKPIFSVNCTFSECHGGTLPLDLRELQQIKEYSPQIKQKTQDRIMPPGKPLSDQEIDKIAAWIDEGCPDN